MKRTLLLTILLCFSVSSFAENVKLKMTQESKWMKFRPYVPEKNEFGFELGNMWEQSNMYWLGGSMGFHIGRCMFSNSQTCQQYADFIGGVGGRDGQTTGVLLSGLRWQFIDLSDRYIPSVRLLVGVMNIRDNVRDKNVFAYGVGYGLTTALHERLDLKFEFRAGYAEKTWTMSFLSFSLKFDKWVDYFAKKLESMGAAGSFLKGTAEVTGKVIKGAVETTSKVIQGTVEQTDKAIKTTVDKTGEAIQKTNEFVSP